MAVPGGFGQIVQLPSNWVVKSPDKLNSSEAMSYGTAGITAAACVKKIVDANISKDLPVLVSGSTGGVGSISVGILKKLGYHIFTQSQVKKIKTKPLRLWEQLKL